MSRLSSSASRLLRTAVHPSTLGPMLLLSSLVLLADPAAPRPQPAPLILYSDEESAITVRLDDPAADTLHFRSDMPDGWSFAIQVDGNKDGAWGSGFDMPEALKATGDRRFGQHASTGALCAQHIYTAWSKDPERTYVSSDCAAYPSRGSFGWSDPRPDGRRSLLMSLPAADIFGEDGEARIQVCIWDTRQMTCRPRLADLPLLTRRK